MECKLKSQWYTTTYSPEWLKLKRMMVNVRMVRVQIAKTNLENYLAVYTKANYMSLMFPVFYSKEYILKKRVYKCTKIGIQMYIAVFL